MTNQIERRVILETLDPVVKDGLKYALRALPPPHGGWLVHIKEADLQDIPDSKRESLLTRLSLAVNHMNNNNVPVGIIRTLE